MKRYYYLLTMLLLLVGCAKSDTDFAVSQKLQYNPKFYVEFENDDTRTYLEEIEGSHNDIRYRMLWHKDDQISIFTSTLNQKYKFDGETGDNSGTFSAISSNQFGSGSSLDVDANYAVYPYNASTKISYDGEISINLPSSQTYAENSFGVNANTMVAVTESSDDYFLSFKNLGGFLKLQLRGDVNIKSIQLKGNNNEKIAGAATVVANYGNAPIVTMKNNATSTITLDCGEGVVLDKYANNPTEFWFVIPPVTFSKGFTITITDVNGDTMTQSTSKSLTLDRNTVQTMKELNVDIEKDDISQGSEIPLNEIWYTTNDGKPIKLNNGLLSSMALSNVYENGKGIITCKGEVDIGVYDFYNCQTLTSISFPESRYIRLMGGNFHSCTALEKVSIPRLNGNIGQEVFSGCYSLKEFTIPEGVKSIGFQAFAYCRSLKDITIPDSVTEIGVNAFMGCSSVETITIGQNVPESAVAFDYSSVKEFHGKYASDDHLCLIVDGTIKGFAHGAGVTEYTFPQGVKIVALGGNKTIQKIIIPNGATEIADRAFSGCTNLTDVVIPNGVIKIGDSAFYGCSNLSNIDIPDGVTKIGSSTFWGCSSLPSITIPDSVTEIGSGAFYDCSSLSSVYLGQNIDLKIINNDIFQRNNSIKEFKGKYASKDNKCLIIDGRIKYFAYGAGLTEYTIPDEATSIGAVFSGNTVLKKIIIPNNITEIEAGAFSGCTYLESVTLPNISNIYSSAFSGCEHLTEIKGEYASFDGRCWIVDGELKFFIPTGLTEYSIPNGVTKIAAGVFNGCANLTDINIPDSVIEIGSNAFNGCVNLAEINIPNGVTNIGANAFSGCSNITSITLPDRATTLTNILRNCTNLRYIYGRYASSDNRCWIVDGELLSFAPAGLTSYTIQDGVTTIGEYVFYSCKNLKRISIPESVTKIKRGAFSYCSSLTNISLPSGLEEIEYDAFNRCTSLKNVTLPKNINKIPQYIFSNCESLTSIEIPENVTIIGRLAFSDCRNLTTIYCKPECPPTLEGGNFNAFAGVPSSCKVYVPQSAVEDYTRDANWYNQFYDNMVGYNFE